MISSQIVYIYIYSYYIHIVYYKTYRSIHFFHLWVGGWGGGQGVGTHWVPGPPSAYIICYEIIIFCQIYDEIVDFCQIYEEIIGLR